MPATSRPTIARGRLGDLDVVRVRLDRPVDRGAAGRHVAGQRELDPRPCRQDVVEREALVADERLGRLVHLDPGQHLLVADPAARVAVGDVDQLRGRCARRRRSPTPGRARRWPRPCRRSPGSGSRCRRRTSRRRRRPPGSGRRAPWNAARTASSERRSRWTPRPWLPSSGLTTHGIAEPLGRRDRAFLGVDDLGARDRQPGRVEQPVGQALVRGDVDPDGRGQRGHRRPDPLLVDAVAELDERMPVEPDERDVAADRLVDERLGRRPEGLPLGEPDEPLHLRREVEEDVGVVGGDEVVDQRDRHPAGLEPDRLLAVLVDAVVLARPTGRPRLAVTDVGPGQVLELERDVLGDVADPCPLAQPGDEAAAPPERAGVVLERRQQRDQRVGEVRAAGWTGTARGRPGRPAAG